VLTVIAVAELLASRMTNRPLPAVDSEYHEVEVSGA